MASQSRALVLISFRRRFFEAVTSLVLPDVAAALAYSSWPILSASAKTLVLTVAPSRRFLLNWNSVSLLVGICRNEEGTNSPFSPGLRNRFCKLPKLSFRGDHSCLLVSSGRPARFKFHRGRHLRTSAIGQDNDPFFFETLKGVL